MEDEAAWLLERLRVGELDQARFALLVHLGSEAARLAAGTGSGRQDEPDLAAWSHGIVDAGARVAFLAALAAAQATVDAEWESPPRAVAELVSLLRGCREGAPGAERLRQAASQAEAVIAGDEQEPGRQRSVLAPLDRARRIAIHGRRAARVATIEALRSSASILGEAAARRAAAEALIPWLRDQDAPLDDGPTAPVRLLVVEDTFGIVERGTCVVPEVDLGADLGPLEFSVEVRRPDRSVLRCHAAASIPRVHPFDPERARRHLLLLLGVPKQDVPPGSEVWEVGP